MHFLEEELRVKEGQIKLQFYGLTWLGMNQAQDRLNMAIDFWDSLNTENFMICLSSDVIFSAPCTIVV
jgi:hypothetical protein